MYIHTRKLINFNDKVKNDKLRELMQPRRRKRPDRKSTTVLKWQVTKSDGKGWYGKRRGGGEEEGRRGRRVGWDGMGRRKSNMGGKVKKKKVSIDPLAWEETGRSITVTRIILIFRYHFEIIYNQKLPLFLSFFHCLQVSIYFRELLIHKVYHNEINLSPNFGFFSQSNLSW